MEITPVDLDAPSDTPREAFAKINANEQSIKTAVESAEVAIAAEILARVAGDDPFDVVEVAGDLATYTLLPAHANCILFFASDTDFTVLLDANIAIDNFVCGIVMGGTGKPTLTADTGLTLEAVSPTIYTQNGQAAIYYKGSNTFYASGNLGQSIVELDTDDVAEGAANLYHTDERVIAALEPTASTGTAIKFDIPRTYGYATAETGNVTLDATDLVEGMTQLLIHNHSGEPTFGAEFSIISGEYATGVANYIMLLAVKSNLILVTISQAA